MFWHRDWSSDPVHCLFDGCDYGDLTDHGGCPLCSRCGRRQRGWFPDAMGQDDDRTDPDDGEPKMANGKSPSVNRLGMKLYPLHRLKVGRSTLVGPYKTAKTVGTVISRCAKRPGRETMRFTQRKMILVDPQTGESNFFWLVTRIE